jgi:hypothetical protein
MGDRVRIDVRPPDDYWYWPEGQRLDWITAFIAEAVATMDAMPDDE